MRSFLILVLCSLASGCFVGDVDGDGERNLDDCAPRSRLIICLDDTGEVVDSGDSELPVDSGETGETGEPCESSVWHLDGDGDGFGSPSVIAESCDQPNGYVVDGTDCNDADSAIYPGAPERCDGADNDCDGMADENVGNRWYQDIDGDGYGAGAPIDVLCEGSSGALVDNNVDCNDGDGSVSPAGIEVCDGVDQDCDGMADEDAADAPSWYADADGDGFGNVLSAVVSCEQPSGHVADASDCDDLDAAVNPGAVELCNGADDDCDGVTDEADASDAGSWYRDADGDGYGDPGAIAVSCSLPAGYAENAGDCNDADAALNPDAFELCNGIDDDCDGVTDESDALDVSLWYRDADGDGYGDALTVWSSCSAPAGYVAAAGDCDDSSPAVSPGAYEYCNGLDDDCDGTADEDAQDAPVWSPDADGDGYGDSSYGSFLQSCEQPEGYLADYSDCDDADAAVSPGGAEVYDDLVDNDCNGIVDDAGVFCCLDGDGDRFGRPDDCVYEKTGECTISGYVIGDGDCDDANASINPDGYDAPYDDVDGNCDGTPAR